MSSVLIEYGWTLLLLIGLEGLLSADNALVLAIIAKHLPENQKRKAINHGIMLAFVFRFLAIFLISFIVGIWQLQAIGAIYLIYMSLKHIFNKYISDQDSLAAQSKRGTGFWPTVFKIGLTDVAFAVDSVLAAFALAVTLPATSLPHIGGMDGGQFTVIVLGTLSGLILIKYAANWFIELLNKRPGLETVAYLIVGWVGVKLAVLTLAHENVAVLKAEFPHSSEWNFVFWAILLLIAIGGWIFSGRKLEQ